ncbi:hypothetical protein RB213_006307 [Colletotrichum asianum]
MHLWAINNREDFAITMDLLTWSIRPDPALLSFSVSAPSPNSDAVSEASFLLQASSVPSAKPTWCLVSPVDAPDATASSCEPWSLISGPKPSSSPPSLNVTLYVGHQRLRQSFSSGLFHHLRPCPAAAPMSLLRFTAPGGWKRDHGARLR